MMTPILWLLLLSTGAFAAAPMPAPAEEDLDSELINDGEIFLEKNGVSDFGKILFYRRSGNVSDCLHLPDISARILQMCAARTAYFQCQNSTGIFLFNDCRGRQCFSRFNRETSSCLYETLGIRFSQVAEQQGMVCGLPIGNQHLFEWRFPVWARAIGGVNNMGCIIALPPGSVLQNRLICEQDYPVLENKILFPSDEFLKGGEKGKIRCVTKQSCGIPDLFSAEVACYETLDLTEQDNLTVQAQNRRPDESLEENSTSSLLVPKPILFLTSLFLIVSFSFSF